MTELNEEERNRNKAPLSKRNGLAAGRLIKREGVRESGRPLFIDWQ